MIVLKLLVAVIGSAIIGVITYKLHMIVLGSWLDKEYKDEF